jgi:restriction endonuclease S subunit
MIESKNYSVLGELVEFANETWDQKTVFDNQFPYIEISNIDTSNGEIAKTDFVPVAEAPSRARMIVREGDIIVSTTRPNRGAITPISKEQDGFIASTGFAILRDLKNGKILKDYLFIALRTSLSLQQMEQRTTGGNYPAITIEDLKKIKIVVPEIKVQEKIIAGVKTIYEKAKGLRHEAGDVVIVAQKQVEQMIFA